MNFFILNSSAMKKNMLITRFLKNNKVILIILCLDIQIAIKKFFYKKIIA